MSLRNLMMRREFRPTWADPIRTIRTLESFGRTEADGARDIAAAARRVGDAELRGHLERHAADELRHAEMFRVRAAELRSERGLSDHELPGSDQQYDLSKGRPEAEVDAHGFYTVGLLDELGEVPYVAMLHVAEQKAERLFAVNGDLLSHDPGTQAIFQQILKDEKYHVAYTGRILDKWRKEGRGREVKDALKEAKESRFIGSWKRLGLRSAGTFARVMLWLFYWTLLLPFGWLASKRVSREGWIASEQRSRLTLDSQG